MSQLQLIHPVVEQEADHGEAQQCRDYIRANMHAIKERIDQGEILPWQCDGYTEPKDVLTALAIIDYEGSILWLDANHAVKFETTNKLGLQQIPNALALMRHLQNDLKYIKVVSYDKDLSAYHFGMTELGRLIFELGEMFSD